MAAAAIAHVNRLDPLPDLVVISGDLADAGTPTEYTAVRTILAALRVPYAVLPGNHDDREPMREAFADHAYLPRTGALHYCLDDWPIRLIALDSTVAGDHHGLIDPPQLRWLADRLAEDNGRPVLVFLHHHPFASGIPYLDRYNLRNADALAAVLAGHPAVAAVLCGHVHRSMATRFAGTLALSCPSTASQIALRLGADAEPASCLEPPGGLLHQLSRDGRVMSHAFPIGDHGPAMDFF
jgi:3',5'-cyclic AMP phosphodiesterase CpdA